jgi:hypothetical protein
VALVLKTPLTDYYGFSDCRVSPNIGKRIVLRFFVERNMDDHYGDVRI